MGKGRSDRRDLAAMPVEDFNRRLKKLRRRAKKALRGEGGSKNKAALRRWQKLQELGHKSSCCGEPFPKRCKRCPRSAGELVVAPLTRP
jgi:hypothetical protein